MTNKKIIIIALVVMAAIIGAIIAVVVSKGGSDDASNKDGEKEGNNADKATADDKNDFGGGAANSIAKNKTRKAVTSDPATAEFSVSALAVGDWGATVYKEGGSCCSRRKKDGTPIKDSADMIPGTEDPLDWNAVEYMAGVLGETAAQSKVPPSVVLGHGDNFYWTGLVSKTDADMRFENTFESKYSHPALQNIPWLNVMGNHDYGGASFICATEDGTSHGECNGIDDMLQHLKLKFDLQAKYVSPNGNRWIMKDHFYVHQLKDPKTGVTVDIFNLDTNDAQVHGADQICCQCYGYSDGETVDGVKKKGLCRTITRGNKYCAGGNTAMYDACMNQMHAWGKDSRDKLVAGVTKSKADWKIVNTHYSPYGHYDEKNSGMWKDLLNGLGVQVWIYGHTHGEKHDWADFGMHFLENGAGGGIQSESASGIPGHAKDYMSNVWTAPGFPYGVVELAASKEWLKVRFLTTGPGWKLDKKYDPSTDGVGEVKQMHCWYIPVDGSKGEACPGSA